MVKCQVEAVYATAHLEDGRDMPCYIEAVKIDGSKIYLETVASEDFEGVVVATTLHFGVIPYRAEIPPAPVTLEDTFHIVSGMDIDSLVLKEA